MTLVRSNIFNGLWRHLSVFGNTYPHSHFFWALMCLSVCFQGGVPEYVRLTVRDENVSSAHEFPSALLSLAPWPVTSKVWLVISADTVLGHSLLQFVVSSFATDPERNKHRLFLPIPGLNEKASLSAPNALVHKLLTAFYKNWLQGTRKFHKF